MDGVDCGFVSIEHSVQVDAGILGIATDNPMLPRDVASFDAAIAVARNQILVHPDGTYVVQVRIARDPYHSRWVIVPKLV